MTRHTATARMTQPKPKGPVEVEIGTRVYEVRDGDNLVKRVDAMLEREGIARTSGWNSDERYAGLFAEVVAYG